MDVRCDKCGTEYEFDDDKVTPQGVNVKCTSCGHVFRVAQATPLRREPQPSIGQGEWMIRQRAGNVFRFKELTTLQKWIVERKVARDDEISKTGQTWKRLGNIAELATFFQVVDGPAAGGHSLETEFSDDQDEIIAAKSNSVLIALVLLGVAAAVFAASFLFRDRISLLFSAPPPPPVAVQDTSDLDVTAGVRSYKRNTDSGFLAAEGLFDKVTTPSADALAAAAINQIAWAEERHEQAQANDKAIKDAAAGTLTLSVAEVAQRAQQMAQSQADQAARTQRATDLIKRASEIDSRSTAVIRANARLLALQGQRADLLSLFDRVQNTPQANDEEVLYALAMTDIGSAETRDHAASLLQKIIDGDADYTAARYELAWIAVQKNDALAASLVGAVLQRVPDHMRALELKAKMAAPASVPASTPAVAPLKEPGKESFEQLLARANLMREREHSKQAMDIYDRALALRPDDAEALTGLGFCFLDRDDSQSAIAEFQKAVRSNPRFSDAYMGLAEAYRARNQKRDAVKNYQKYLDITPDGPEAEVAHRALKDLGQAE